MSIGGMLSIFKEHSLLMVRKEKGKLNHFFPPSFIVKIYYRGNKWNIVKDDKVKGLTGRGVNRINQQRKRLFRFGSFLITETPLLERKGKDNSFPKFKEMEGKRFHFSDCCVTKNCSQKRRQFWRGQWCHFPQFQPLPLFNVEKRFHYNNKILLKFFLQTLIRWLLTVQKNYRDVPYHNFRHAFNVAQIMFAILTVSKGEI